ncbi:hypothetical protein LL270_12975 [Pseudomonas aestusnigri]|uniref:hypothetical protein n=1 Tax=Halopseudomonas aestusnigri TaxID=857252 RepID=UPI001D185A47|nr:hypothetical protein [Halopseudomonas aestusnigri]MCC4261564.1 hypothetical protein [Halopseudomonas aestusnigri]
MESPENSATSSNAMEKEQLQLFAFRTTEGHFGLIQKDENSVIYFVETDNPIYKIRESNSWDAWVQHVDAGYASGCTDTVTKEALGYYLRKHCETINPEITELKKVKRPGAYYPRIARENIDFNYVSTEFLQDARAYRNIQSALDDLFNYIEPSEITLTTYSHKIRELLILACTEVECLLVNTITKNGYKKKNQYSTKDYIKCKSILGLSSYEVQLTQYPTLKTFTPFLGWCCDNTTATLPWYKAYNAVKHNRSENIKDANLNHLLNAVAAIHILLESQYGKEIFSRWANRTDEKSIYTTTKRATWRCDHVFAPILIDGYSPVGDWKEERKYFEDYPD